MKDEACSTGPLPGEVLLTILETLPLNSDTQPRVLSYCSIRQAIQFGAYWV